MRLVINTIVVFLRMIWLNLVFLVQRPPLRRLRLFRALRRLPVWVLYQLVGKNASRLKGGRITSIIRESYGCLCTLTSCNALPERVPQHGWILVVKLSSVLWGQMALLLPLNHNPFRNLALFHLGGKCDLRQQREFISVRFTLVLVN